MLPCKNFSICSLFGTIVVVVLMILYCNPNYFVVASGVRGHLKETGLFVNSRSSGIPLG